MSSINTNVSAMQALQSLNNTNQALETTQQRISTGYKVGDAKDNAAIWSVAQVMRSDVSGFGAISEQLSLGESTVAVARNASETVSDLVGQIKERVISGQGDNVDREKIQNDINELVGQVQSVVDAAQFNGTNLLKDGDNSTFDILSSLDRDSSQNVTASDISVNKQNLSTSTDDSIIGALNNLGTTAATAQVDPTDYAAGDIQSVTVTVRLASDGSASTETIDVSGQGSMTDIATELTSELDDVNLVNYAAGPPSQFTFDDSGGVGNTIEGITFNGAAAGLKSLGDINVNTDDGVAAEHALASMEAFTQTAIDAASNFGSAQMRVETQMNFVSKLSDSLEAGVGSLVDANMTEESAKLNALQVQQQLGTQALSIANQSPQNLLSLFR